MKKLTSAILSLAAFAGLICILAFYGNWVGQLLALFGFGYEYIAGYVHGERAEQAHPTPTSEQEP